ncbi:Putative major facilitator superfamily, MFS transporter superfamily [Septoria linicola]|uniref:Major facilitator superfamily, MFS transporter superfamily n=1 Tax=Septoria linicola TaxID=215465 RepID=A0A9Q9B025_9PEZI|nr:putative major facilitator superfamily, MFS transporter superfamily [Septoria linicola]USW55017.1 Putative major facilitator superfamily, MFS transporter superfamily [Septoria linicola]
MSETPREDIPSQVKEELRVRGFNVDSDNVVSWLEDAPLHPKNWPLARKLYDTAAIAAFVTVSAMIGNGGNTIALKAAADLGLSNLQSNVVFAAVFYYSQAIGSLVIPPYSETFGRKQTNLIASLGLAAMCAICSIDSVVAVASGRSISGFLTAMPAVVGAGSVEDMWSIRARIWALDIWMKGAIVGIALGPCYATFISTSDLRWPWVFRPGAVLLAASSMSFVWTKESRPNRIMQQQLAIVAKTTGYKQLVPDSTDAVPTLQGFVTTMMVRPVKMFFTEPIVCTVSIMSGTVYASVFLLTPGQTVAYEAFGYNERKASLVFLAWVVGLMLTIPLRVLDWRLGSRAVRSHTAVTPEDKITGFFIAAPVLACSMWWWSWTVPPSSATLSSWISIAALVFVGACVNEFDGVLAGYLVDSYTTYAASANAPLAFLRALLSGSFPLFGRQLYEGLGSNVSGSIVASVATIFVLIALWFWAYGPHIRQRSPIASTVSKE